MVVSDRYDDQPDALSQRSPMRWTQLLSPARLTRQQKPAEAARSPFHKDYDRIVFSSSFRQLNRKTQVHPLTLQDGIHTRLTHSLEVSCVGRSLGMLAAEKIAQDLPPWVTPADVGVIIQAACLAHDIGNPPFGHAGEYAIRDWFGQPANAGLLASLTEGQRSDLLQYEGNAQGFRILTRLEFHPDAGGMRLTYATLGAFLKYPWLALSASAVDGIPSHRRRKFGCYQRERDLLVQTGEHLGLIQTGDAAFCRHPLAYLLEAADDICYALIDLEDGIRLGMLPAAEVEQLFVQLVGDYGLPSEMSQPVSTQRKLAALRGRAMSRLVDRVTDVFQQQQQALLRGQLQGSLLDHCERDLGQGIEQAKQMARDHIFSHPAKARLELTASASLQTLLDEFIPLALPQPHSGFRQQRLDTLLKAQQVHLDPAAHPEALYPNLLGILDYIAGLSDHQAYQLAQELQGRQVSWS